MLSKVLMVLPSISLHQFHQLAEAVHHVVLHLLWGEFLVDIVEEFAGALDLGFLDLAQLHAGHRTLGFGHEIDVLDRTFLEGDGPVGVVVTHRRRDQEPAWQLGVDYDFFTGVQLLHELAFGVGVGQHIVVDMPLQLIAGLAEVLLVFVPVY